MLHRIRYSASTTLTPAARRQDAPVGGRKAVSLSRLQHVDGAHRPRNIVVSTGCLPRCRQPSCRCQQAASTRRGCLEVVSWQHCLAQALSRTQLPGIAGCSNQHRCRVSSSDVARSRARAVVAQRLRFNSTPTALPTSTAP
eukprot:5328629-Prymnesium_polylepis.1